MKYEFSDDKGFFYVGIFADDNKLLAVFEYLKSEILGWQLYHQPEPTDLLKYAPDYVTLFELVSKSKLDLHRFIVELVEIATPRTL